MQESSNNNITSFLLTITFLMLLLAGFILTVLYLYRKKQLDYLKNIQNIKSEFENNLLNSQLEIQEQTNANISKEIHDNISLTLTLAKLNLLTFSFEDLNKSKDLLVTTIDLISKSILDLSDISKSMNSNTIEQTGLIEGLKVEIGRIYKTGIFQIKLTVRGNPEFLDCKTDLLIFRIIQESLNNVIKHAKASIVEVDLYYRPKNLDITILDNGKGFDSKNPENKLGSGLYNMKSRAKVLNGNFSITSSPTTGTKIELSIPTNYLAL